MADQKISELTALTGANVADDDAIAIVDTSATETKKIVFSELKNALDTATGFVRITGDTMTGALDVQSTITSDGLTVAGDAKISATSPTLRITETDTTDVNTRITAGSGNLYIQTENDAENSRTDRLKIDHSTGDISFYEDTGSTPKFFWDSSAESLGIGTSSPTNLLHLKDEGYQLLLEDTSSGNTGEILVSDTSLYFFSDRSNAEVNSDIRFSVDGSERMRLDSSGHVTIGNTSTTPWSLSSGSGAVIRSEGYAGFAASSAAIELNRVGSDGNIANFRKDGSTVGSIGVGQSSDLYIGTSDTGILTSSSESITPWNPSTNVGRDAAIDLGTSDHRFKDLFLSSNLKVGGTNSFQFQKSGTNGYINMADTGALIIRNGTGFEERMRITSAGNVGIGTATAGRRLTVKSNISATVANFESTSSVSGLVSFSDSNTTNDETVRVGAVGDNLVLQAGGSERMRISSSEVDINNPGQSQTLLSVGGGSTNAALRLRGSTGSAYAWQISSNAYLASALEFTKSTAVGGTTFSTPLMILDNSGNLLVGHTSAFSPIENGGSGVTATPDGQLFAGHAGPPLYVNREDSDGDIAIFRKDGSTVGSVGAYSGDLYVVNAGGVGAGLRYNSGFPNILPCNGTGADRDNAIDLGASSVRFDDIYATNGTIQTSDRNEKQDIAELTDAEQRVAVAAKGLLRKFRWKDAVAEKGDEARTHFGIIAQDLQAAFAAEGLDAGDYAMFISSTWTDEETGEERTRMGVRYSELLAFIIAAI